MVEFKHVNGKGGNKVVLYALSTCGWCKKVKNLLNSLGIAYDYIDIDQIDEKTSDELDAIVRKWNPAGTYPTIVVDNKRAIISYEEEKIKELAE